MAVNDLVDKPRVGSDWGGLPAVVAEIEALGRRSLAITADVADAAQVQAMVHRVVDELGSLDIMVTNAGTPAGRDRVPIVELEEEHWDRVLRVNAKGTFLCCQAAARVMIKAKRGGRIITMSSLSGKNGRARFGAYASSKFAVVGLTQALAHELGPHGITVNALCPGVIDTERYRDIANATRGEDTSTEERLEGMFAGAIRATPLGPGRQRNRRRPGSRVSGRPGQRLHHRPRRAGGRRFVHAVAEPRSRAEILLHARAGATPFWAGVERPPSR